VFVSMSSTALIGVPQHDAGVASALVNTMQQVGGSLGVAFLNTIATTATAHYVTSHPGNVPEAATHGFTIAFGISAAVFAVATVVVTALVRAGRTDVAPPSASNDSELEPVLAPVG
jgi:hypothetical protein